MRSRSYRGFTLIEILVVASSLLIVAAFLFPIVNKNRQNRERAFCREKLKAISLAMAQYTMDSDNTFPPNGQPRSTGTSWGQVIQPYLYHSDLLACQSGARETTASLLSSSHAADYYFNANLSSKNIISTKTASKTLLFGEGELASSNYACLSFEECSGTSADGPVGAVPEEAKTRHLEGANYAFVDGHISWLRPERIAQPSDQGKAASFALK